MVAVCQMLQGFQGFHPPLQNVIQGISAAQGPFTPLAPPSESVRTSAMAVLHAANWSYRQIGLAFGCDHKTVKEHVCPTEAFLAGSDCSRPPAVQGDTELDSRGLVVHFILFKLLENPHCSVRDIGWNAIHSVTAQMLVLRGFEKTLKKFPIYFLRSI
jgi:hypothetical protein